MIIDLLLRLIATRSSRSTKTKSRGNTILAAGCPLPAEFYVALYNQRQGAQVPKQLRRAIQRPRARPHSVKPMRARSLNNTHADGAQLSLSFLRQFMETASHDN